MSATPSEFFEVSAFVYRGTLASSTVLDVVVGVSIGLVYFLILERKSIVGWCRSRPWRRETHVDLLARKRRELGLAIAAHWGGVAASGQTCDCDECQLSPATVAGLIDPGPPDE